MPSVISGFSSPEWRTRLESLGLNAQYIATLLDAEAEDERFSYLPLIEEHLNSPELATFLANYFVNVEIPMRRVGKADHDIKDAVRAEIYLALYGLVIAGKLSSTNAKALLGALLEQGILPESIEKYTQEQGFIQVSDKGEIEKVVKKVIDENPSAAEDVKKGEMKAIGFLVGQVMKESQGKANPALAQELLKKRLGV